MPEPELQIATIRDGENPTFAFVDETIFLQARRQDLEDADEMGYVRGFDHGFKAAKRREQLGQFIAWLAIAGMFAAAVYFGLAGR